MRSYYTQFAYFRQAGAVNDSEESRAGHHQPRHAQRPPQGEEARRLALLPSEQDHMVECSIGPWCLEKFLEMASATGCRRGEVLALRWCDIRNDAAFVDRSLCQTRDGLTFKSTRTETPRRIELPPATMPVLASHREHRRERHDEFRRQFGPHYRSDLDLVIANPDGTRMKPDSVSGTVTRLCRMVGLPKGASLHTVRQGWPLPVQMMFTLDHAAAAGDRYRS
jgi:integrase